MAGTEEFYIRALEPLEGAFERYEILKVRKTHPNHPNQLLVNTETGDQWVEFGHNEYEMLTSPPPVYRGGIVEAGTEHPLGKYRVGDRFKVLGITLTYDRKWAFKVQRGPNPGSWWRFLFNGIYTVIDFGPEAEVQQAAITRPACPKCGTELCEMLDAYYGRDPEMAKYCDRCRRKR